MKQIPSLIFDIEEFYAPIAHKMSLTKPLFTVYSSPYSYLRAATSAGTPFILMARRRLYERQNKAISAVTLAKPFNKK